MKPAFKVKTIALGVTLLCTALSCTGLTLGRARGAILVGKPLNLLIQVQTEEREDIASGCFEADVFHADARQDPSRVRVTYEQGFGVPWSGGGVRVVSTALVDEPVVTVYLRAGCTQKTARRYVMLADVVSEMVDAAPSIDTARIAGVTELPVVRSGTDAPKTASASTPARAAASAPAKATAVPLRSVAGAAKIKPVVGNGGQVVAPARAEPAKVSQAPQVAKAVPSRELTRAPVAALKSSSKSRLKLDPLDLMIERDPVLQSSVDMLTIPQEDLGKREQAAAMWRAINATPEEILRDAARMQTVEADVKSLRAITTANASGLLDLKARLQKAESERYANGLVYGLLGLLAAALAALALLWRRQHAAHRTPDWWHGQDAGDSVMPARAQVREAVKAVQPAGAAPAEVDFYLDLDQEPPALEQQASAVRVDGAPRVSPPKAARPDLAPIKPQVLSGRDFSVSVPGSMRSMDTEELVDVRHQAEFFLSLGQYDQAVNVLQSRIDESGESSPMVYLDLLKVLHTLGKKQAFEVTRKDFNRWFTGRIPDFSTFAAEGQELEAYPEVLGQIVALWPTPSVLELIEDCLFRNPHESPAPGFDLAAYRDLLMLHGVAKRIIRIPDEDLDSRMFEPMRVPAHTQAAAPKAKPHVVGSASPSRRVSAPARPLAPGQSDNSPESETRGSPLTAVDLSEVPSDALPSSGSR